ncbi:MAG: hypothetical protein JW829_05135 [Pirellulales bacterium]|nr:hypothetical protein [Pirellulales bacterium]
MKCICLGIRQRRVDASDGLVDFHRRLESDHHRVHEAALHGESDGFLAVLGLGEIAVANDLHANDAVALRTHDLDLFD